MELQKTPLISIALCTYNGEQHLREQLDSILSQTYKNLEIIIVDDVSTDRTVSIIRSYAERDGRIKYYLNERNLGFNKNFEKALTLTSGEFIAISDQDDIWLPEKIEVLHANIADNWLIFSNSSFIGDTGAGQLLKGFKLPPDYKGILLYNHVTGHTTLLSRKLLDFALPFPQKGYYDWWMGFVATYHHKIIFLDQVLTRYRIHSGSVMQKEKRSGKSVLIEFNKVTTMLYEFALYKGLDAEDKTFIDGFKTAYQLKGSRSRSIPLMQMILKYYRQLFPNFKERRSFSKFNFAFKFSVGIRA